ncbi:MAG: glycoside hydrolase family 18 protein [Bacteroidota bacterium]
MLLISLFCLIISTSGCVRAETEASNQAVQPNPNIWVSAYLATWQHDAGTPYSNWGAVTTEEIDWDAFTHLFYFALNIGPDGRPSHSFDPTLRRNMNADRLKDIVPAAHRHQKKILLSVGGSGNYEGFKSSIQPQNRDQFIATLTEMITKYGFDGIDLDMEPIRPSDYNNFKALVKELHNHFSNIKTRQNNQPMITIAALKGPSISRVYAEVQEYVDQINIMTYDMAQAWSGWQAWHNSALFNDRITFDRTGELMPSVHNKLNIAMQAGIARQKLGIGIDFYGYIWHGIHRLEKWPDWPRQDLSIIERSGGVPYSELHERYPLDRAAWDPIAETSFLNLDQPRAFISFDNERSVRRKIQFASQEGIGGVILWEIGGGYLPANVSGTRAPLLQAIQHELSQLPQP